MTAHAIRTREVTPPSVRDETLAVARAVVLVVCGTLVFIGGRARDPADASALAASPFERRFEDLEAADQRVYRALREGIAEAERRRFTSGAWPGTEELAREGIPPFAPDPIDRAGYAWSIVRSSTLANYVGVPSAASGRPSFVVIVTEPEPGAPVDPLAREDEVHHRLPSGAMLHLTVWMGPAPEPRATPVGFLRPEQGYRQVLVGSAPPG